MNYQISALSADDFSHLVGLNNDELAEHGGKRMKVAVNPGCYAARVDKI